MNLIYSGYVKSSTCIVHISLFLNTFLYSFLPVALTRRVALTRIVVLLLYRQEEPAV